MKARGSWVSSLRSRIEYFESLLPFCDSVTLLQQRQRVEERIASLHRRLEVEKRRDFMKDD